MAAWNKMMSSVAKHGILGLWNSWAVWASSVLTGSPKRIPDLTMHVHWVVCWAAKTTPCRSFLLIKKYTKNAMGTATIRIAWLNVVSNFALFLHGSLEVGQLHSKTDAEQGGFFRPGSFKFLIEPLTVPDINDGTSTLFIRLDKSPARHLIGRAQNLSHCM